MGPAVPKLKSHTHAQQVGGCRNIGHSHPELPSVRPRESTLPVTNIAAGMIAPLRQNTFISFRPKHLVKMPALSFAGDGQSLKIAESKINERRALSSLSTLKFHVDKDKRTL